MSACACWNVKHVNPRRACPNAVTKQCTVCNEKLCGGCAKNHHQHNSFVKLKR